MICKLRISHIALCLVFLIPATSHQLFSQCDHPDYDELMRLYNSANGGNWVLQVGWEQGAAGNDCEVCSWAGITCENNRVVKLDFSTSFVPNNLKGVLPNLQLEKLEQLDLSLGEFNFGLHDFSGMPNLKKLDLRRCKITGNIPNFSNLTQLEELDLSENLLVGELPDFSNLPNLKILDLEDNRIENYHDFENMPLLEELLMSMNNIRGPVFDLENLPNLKKLHLDGSELLVGEIPDFSNLPELEEFLVSGYNLVDGLPEFKSCPKLRRLEIYQTDLQGEIPLYDWLTELEILNLTKNKLTGEMPFFENQHITELSLKSNRLTGTIPYFSFAENLTVFDCGSNLLHGCFPDYVCNIEEFSANKNLEMPWSGNAMYFCNGESQIDAPCNKSATALDYEIINGDCECGEFECSWYHPEFETLMDFYYAAGGENWDAIEGWEAGTLLRDCDPCRLSAYWEGITCENGRVVCIDLDGLHNCAFQGITGVGLEGEFSKLDLEFVEHIRLNHNEMSGPLPDISGMPNLKVLSLAYNNFEGEIPDYSQHPSLEQLRITGNNLSGPVPDFTDLKTLNVFTAAVNDLSGCYHDYMCDLEIVDFTLNQQMPFVGDIREFCKGGEQLGSDCINLDSDSTEIYTFINENCSCGMLSSLTTIDTQNYLAYPNPVENSLTIDTAIEFSSIKIFDKFGNEANVKIRDLSAINMRNLSTGVYFIVLSDKNGNHFTEKLIKL